MIRFIHLADVHLGAVPDKGCPWSHEREEEIWETFRRVIAGIRNNPVELLFIAGDLFHRQPLQRELKEVNYLFSTIPDTKVFLMAGNHDYMKPGSFYRDFSWGSNVFFFGREQIERIQFPEEKLYVYGLSYEHREIREALYDECKAGTEEGFHVLLAHGGDADHIPMDFKRLGEAGFDYLALGHIHKPHAKIRGKAIYSGTPEPIDRGETGRHGYIAGQYEDGIVKTKFIRFASRSYEVAELSVDETSTQYSLQEQLSELIMEKGRRNMYRVVLRGVRAPETLILAERLKTLGQITDIADETRPAYDLEALSKKYGGTLIGNYIRYFMDKDERSAVEEKALYHGLQALLETTVLTDGRKKL